MTLTSKWFAKSLLSAALAATAWASQAQTVGSDRPIKIAVTVSAEHPITVGANRFSELITAKSDGQLKSRVYANAGLGNDVQVISSLQGGTVEAAVVSVGLLTSMAKEFNLFILPGVFHNVKEADAVMDGPFGTGLRQRLQERGLVGLAYFEHGFKNITNNKRPIEKWEDASGLKIRVTQTPSLVDAFNRLGANPVPMAFGELYNALEQRAIDGMETTLATFESGKFYEVQKYMGLTQHVYDPLMLIFSLPVWEKLSPDQRKIIADSALEAAMVQRRATREREAKLLIELREKGMTVTELSVAEKERIRERLKPVTDKYTQVAGEDGARLFFAELEKARAAAVN